MREEIKAIIENLPKKTIVSVLIVAMGFIIFLIGYIGRVWYDRYTKKAEADKQEIIEVFKSEMSIFKYENSLMHQKTDREIDRLSNKVEVLSEEQDDNIRRILKQIDKDLKRSDHTESYLPPIEPIERELSYFDSVDVKKKQWMIN